MAKTPNNDKGKGFLGDVQDSVENALGEVTPEDMHEPVMQTINALVGIVEGSFATPEQRVVAAEEVLRFYQTVLGKDFVQHTVDRLDRTNNRAIDEVRRSRREGKQPYEKDDDEE